MEVRQAGIHSTAPASSSPRDEGIQSSFDPHSQMSLGGKNDYGRSCQSARIIEDPAVVRVAAPILRHSSDNGSLLEFCRHLSKNGLPSTFSNLSNLKTLNIRKNP